MALARTFPAALARVAPRRVNNSSEVSAAARNIGRVGALAVALGVGSAVLAMPAVAADTAGSAGSSGDSSAAAGASRAPSTRARSGAESGRPTVGTRSSQPVPARADATAAEVGSRGRGMPTPAAVSPSGEASESQAAGDSPMPADSAGTTVASVAPAIIAGASTPEPASGPGAAAPAAAVVVPEQAARIASVEILLYRRFPQLRR